MSKTIFTYKKPLRVRFVILDEEGIELYTEEPDHLIMPGDSAQWTYPLEGFVVTTS